MGNLERENFDTFDLRYFSDKPNPELYKSEISPRQNINLINVELFFTIQFLHVLLDFLLLINMYLQKGLC